MKQFQNLFYAGLFILSLIFSRQLSQAYFHPTVQVDTTISLNRVNTIYTELPLDKQVSILLVLVDPAKEPQLMGIWWLALAPQAPVTFMPVFPSYKDTDTYSQELVTRYKLVKGKLQYRELDPAFLEHLKVLELPLDGYIVMDPTALAVLVDFLGGITIGNQPLNGQQATLQFINPYKDSIASLVYQTSLWEQVCKKAVFAGSSGNFEIVLPELARHAITSPGFPLTFASYQSYITGQSSISCSVNPAGME